MLIKKKNYKDFSGNSSGDDTKSCVMSALLTPQDSDRGPRHLLIENLCSEATNLISNNPTIFVTVKKLFSPFNVRFYVNIFILE